MAHKRIEFTENQKAIIPANPKLKTIDRKESFLYSIKKNRTETPKLKTAALDKAKNSEIRTKINKTVQSNIWRFFQLNCF